RKLQIKQDDPNIWISLKYLDPLLHRVGFIERNSHILQTTYYGTAETRFIIGDQNLGWVSCLRGNFDRRLQHYRRTLTAGSSRGVTERRRISRDANWRHNLGRLLENICHLFSNGGQILIDMQASVAPDRYSVLWPHIHLTEPFNSGP